MWEVAQRRQRQRGGADQLATRTYIGHGDGTAPAWKREGACWNTNSDVFFEPIRGQASYREARKICMGCSVRIECLDYAVRTHQNDGMWGGLTPRERRRLRR